MMFSLTAFGQPLEHYAALAVRAEARGFEAFWLGDHVITPLVMNSRYPYSATGAASYGADIPVADTWVTVAHMAARTQKIKLGPGVFLLPMRHPILAARAAVTAHQLSNGRALFGFGAGWLQEEFEALGADFANRGERLDEMLEILAQLFRGKPVSFAGRYYRFPEVQLSPCPSTPIPLIAGGTTRAAMARAARHADGWLGPTCTLADSIGHRKRLLALLAEAGRSHVDFTFYARLVDPPTPDIIARYQDAGFEHLVIGIPRTGADLAASLAWLDTLAEKTTELPACAGSR